MTATLHPDFDHILERRIQRHGMTRCEQYLACSCGAEIVFRKKKIRMPPDILSQKAARKGWTVDLKHGHHRCPSCSTGSA